MTPHADRRNFKAHPARWLALTFAFLVTLMALGYLNIRAIYQAALFKWLGDQVTIGLDKTDRHAVYKALFDYTNSQIDRRMMPGLGKSSLEYLNYGYALCDQEAMLLDTLLYYQNVEARVVPLYYPNGASDHTMLEWFDGREWLLSDPHFDHELGLPAKALVGLPKQEVLSRYPKLPEKVYDYYKKHYFSELSHTYSTDSYTKWFEFARTRSFWQRILDRVAILPLVTFQSAYLEALNSIYLFRTLNDHQPEDLYIIARLHELLGHCDVAMSMYARLQSENIPQAWPHYTKFTVNREMLKQRVEWNRKSCGNHRQKHYPRGTAG